jgi:hypothetical protein
VLLLIALTLTSEPEPTCRPPPPTHTRDAPALWRRSRRAVEPACRPLLRLPPVLPLLLVLPTLRRHRSRGEAFRVYWPRGANCLACLAHLGGLVHRKRDVGRRCLGRWLRKR